jgi:hypothetical protein
MAYQWRRPGVTNGQIGQIAAVGAIAAGAALFEAALIPRGSPPGIGKTRGRSAARQPGTRRGARVPGWSAGHCSLVVGRLSLPNKGASCASMSALKRLAPVGDKCELSM